MTRKGRVQHRYEDVEAALALAKRQLKATPDSPAVVAMVGVLQGQLDRRRWMADYIAQRRERERKRKKR